MICDEVVWVEVGVPPNQPDTMITSPKTVLKVLTTLEPLVHHAVLGMRGPCPGLWQQRLRAEVF